MELNLLVFCLFQLLKFNYINFLQKIPFNFVQVKG